VAVLLDGDALALGEPFCGHLAPPAVVRRDGTVPDADTTSTGAILLVLIARSKNRRPASASRRADTNTSMTCPAWSIAR